MALSKRIFLFYFLFVALCGYFMTHLFSRQVYPSIRQTTEETLVDTANLLAEVVSFDLKEGRITPNYLQQRMQTYQRRNPQAEIWGIPKNEVSLNVYITDEKGIVIFDSESRALGKDYSQWRDVYLTLRGEYGARSSKEIVLIEGAEVSTTLMHVAAPIYYDQNIIGVLTVSKPNRATDAYVENAKSELIYFAILLLGTSILVGALLSWWLGVSFRKLIDYAKKLGKGKRQKQPKFYGKDMNILADTLSNLRKELDGKEYVEHYVNTLTHELKSPLAAICATNELLQNEMAEQERLQFLENIDRETARLQNLIDRVLKLSMVEKTQALTAIQTVDISELLETLFTGFSSLVEQKNIQVDLSLSKGLMIQGDLFLMRQALTNIIHNAIDFMPRNGVLTVMVTSDLAMIYMRVHNEGMPIPDYAMSRLYERFYSLPRPDSGEKSTGLGLNFVKEIMALHQGYIDIENSAIGVSVLLAFPRVII